MNIGQAFPDKAKIASLEAEIGQLRVTVAILLAREIEWATLSGFSDCRCISLSRAGEREYETGKCPHQLAAAMLGHQQQVTEPKP